VIAYFSGMLVALTMTLSVGPGLLLYFQACIRNGFVAGMAVLFGLWVSDISIISITIFGYTQFIATINNQRIVAILCAIILLLFGVVQWIKKPSLALQANLTETSGQKTKLLKGLISGFLINTSNPFVYVFWMTLVGIVSVDFGTRTQPFFIFFTGLFSSACAFDTIKCFTFSKVKIYFKPAQLTWVNRIAGSGLVVAAIVIASKAFL